VGAVAFGTVGDRPIAVTGGGDGTVRLDLQHRRLLGDATAQPLQCAGETAHAERSSDANSPNKTLQ